jgi:hypothetical protein
MFIQRTDIDFINYAVLKENGEEVPFVVSADDEKGVYFTYDRDENGHIKFNPDFDPIIKFNKGRIKIEEKTWL